MRRVRSNKEQNTGSLDRDPVREPDMDGESDGLGEIVSITTWESMSDSAEVTMSHDANFNGTRT